MIHSAHVLIGLNIFLELSVTFKRENNQPNVHVYSQACHNQFKKKKLTWKINSKNATVSMTSQCIILATLTMNEDFLTRVMAEVLSTFLCTCSKILLNYLSFQSVDNERT